MEIRALGELGLGGRSARGPAGTHRVVVRVQVGHEHSGEGAQDPVHVVSEVTAQLPERALATVQQQGLVGAAEEQDTGG